MHTILVLTLDTNFGPSVAASLDPARWRVVSHEDAAAAAPLFTRHAVDMVLLDLDLVDAQILRVIEEVRARAGTLPIFIAAENTRKQWIEEAILLGVRHIVEKPLRGRLLGHLIERELGTGLAITAPQPPIPLSAITPIHSLPAALPSRHFDELRRFSSLLIHSLDAKELLKHALRQVRESLGVNRAAVFLRKPDSLGNTGAPSTADRRLRVAHSIGHEAGVLEQFELSLDSGIGAHLHQHFRILRAGGTESRTNREIAQDFRTLASSVAVPIVDQDTFVGVLCLDERITGGTFADDELLHLFHWLEELATALRNCWRHNQLAAGHELIDAILASSGDGCVVVGANRAILHANDAALRFLFPEGSRQRAKKKFIFEDLPQALGSEIFRIIGDPTGNGLPGPAVKWLPEHIADIICRLRVIPFRAPFSESTAAALLVIEDVTEHEKLIKTEVERNRLSLVRQMAWHLAHEIGNALTPISTVQQLINADEIKVAEDHEELVAQMGESVRRVQRLTQRMNFLSNDWDGKNGQTIKVADLVQSAYHEAHTLCPGKKVASLKLEKTTPFTVTGDPKALKHAFTELILNALQASPDNPTVTVRIAETQGEGRTRLAVEVEDTGPGFTPDVAEEIGSPFESGHAVGLGLGLTVSKKIIENHAGTIEIPPGTAQGGIVRVTLPVN